MTTIQVFDPAMCCSTGICGPSIDPQLVRFSADLEWLKQHGVEVSRFNLSQQPAAFAQDASVKAALESHGEAALPLLKINGEVKSTGVYPTRDELAHWAGVALDAVVAKPRTGGCCGPKPSVAAAVSEPSTGASDAVTNADCCGPSDSSSCEPGCC
ncbi:MAG: arsenite efflux transporter metallochaperone ArsD [Kofleriaceae bacterium]|nr:arsenite efflux transporter metallochaperone ArsD [Kofleriaceae bacterium]